MVQTDLVSTTVTLDETYRYDAAGNRREVRAISDGTTVDAWYTYDGDNRVAISAGQLVNGAIQLASTAYSYELACLNGWPATTTSSTTRPRTWNCHGWNIGYRSTC